jgi:hypothetical protein
VSVTSTSTVWCTLADDSCIRIVASFRSTTRNVSMAHRRISSTTKRSPHVVPEYMKAAAVDRFGPPSALTLHEIPVPQPGPQEVLIAIDTAGIGSWDASIRDGSWRRPGRTAIPAGARR